MRLPYLSINFIPERWISEGTIPTDTSSGSGAVQPVVLSAISQLRLLLPSALPYTFIYAKQE
jgi:hypothetical protein